MRGNLKRARWISSRHPHSRYPRAQLGDGVRHEEEAFRAYAEALPNNAIFLVDTFDTLKGVDHAIETGRWLRQQGHDLAGIRLDSGDLAWLSIEARRMMNEADSRKRHCGEQRSR
jgi:nicotinic acid phosphoribosyltransferase